MNLWVLSYRKSAPKILHREPMKEHFNAWEQEKVKICCCSVTQSSLNLQQAHRLQHARTLYSSPSLRSCSNSCPLSRWYHPIISSSIIPFYSCFQSFQASGSFLMSRLFVLGSQSIGASASASVFPMNIQDWFPLGLTDLTSFQSMRLSREPSPTPQFKSIISLEFNFLYGPTLTSIHDCWKNQSFD